MIERYKMPKVVVRQVGTALGLSIYVRSIELHHVFKWIRTYPSTRLGNCLRAVCLGTVHLSETNIFSLKPIPYVVLRVTTQINQHMCVH